jgi:hypothetical protein
MTPALLDRPMAKSKPSSDTPADKPVSIVVLKGSPAYRDWVNSFAKASRMPLSVLLDVALAKMAKEEGFEPPPER